MNVQIGSGSTTISGSLYSVSGTKTLIIVCHGFKSSKNHPAIQGIVDYLYKEGHTVFPFNFSEASKPFNLQQQVRDIQQIVDHFTSYKHIILLGGSFGALSAMLCTVTDKRISGLITINGFFGQRPLLRGPIFTYLAFRVLTNVVAKYKQIWSYYRKHYSPEKISVPSLVIYAEDDQTLDTSQSQNFYDQLMAKREVYVLKNGDHNLSKENNVTEVSSVIDSWLNENRFN